MLRVVGVGDNFVDRYWDENTMYPGGNSVNFAVYARQQGAFSAYCGVLAEDREARLIERALVNYGVEYTHCLRLPGGETGVGSIRLINGDRVISDDNDGGSVRTDPLPVTEELLLYLKSFDVIHMCCYGYLAPQLHRIASTGVPVLYDFSDQWTQDGFEQICADVKVAFLSGGGRPSEELEEALRRACGCGAEIAIATMGGDGAIAWDGKRLYRKRPYEVNAERLDTMGAGDAFLTGFAVAYFSGLKLLDALTQERSLAQKDEADYREHLVEYAMCNGDLCAMRSCSTRGAFGMGQPIQPEG